MRGQWVGVRGGVGSWAGGEGSIGLRLPVITTDDHRRTKFGFDGFERSRTEAGPGRAPGICWNYFSMFTLQYLIEDEAK